MKLRPRRVTRKSCPCAAVQPLKALTGAFISVFDQFTELQLELVPSQVKPIQTKRFLGENKCYSDKFQFKELYPTPSVRC